MIVEELLFRALTLQPKSAETNYMLGTCRLAHADASAAVVPLQAAVDALPASMEYRLALGDALVQTKRKQEAIQQYEMAIPLVPESEREGLRAYVLRLQKSR